MIRTVTLRFRKPEPGTTQIPDRTEVKRRLMFIDGSPEMERISEIVGEEESKWFTAEGLVFLFCRAVSRAAKESRIPPERVRALQNAIPAWILTLVEELDIAEDAAFRYVQGFNNPWAILPGPRPSRSA